MSVNNIVARHYILQTANVFEFNNLINIDNTTCIITYKMAYKDRINNSPKQLSNS